MKLKRNRLEIFARWIGWALLMWACFAGHYALGIAWVGLTLCGMSESRDRNIDPREFARVWLDHWRPPNKRLGSLDPDPQYTEAVAELVLDRFRRKRL